MVVKVGGTFTRGDVPYESSFCHKPGLCTIKKENDRTWETVRPSFLLFSSSSVVPTPTPPKVVGRLNLSD